MFEEGDMLVYVKYDHDNLLVSNKIYVVERCPIVYNPKYKTYITYVYIKGYSDIIFQEKDFITLQEHRERKILKLKENICLK